MNQAKKEYMELINNLPDNVGAEEIVDSVKTKAD